jgi:pimeloyl-ACP methyl ester carboxylesterase
MNEISHRTIETNGIRMHLAEKGAGPLVILCHGFPEFWYSWRHQLAALSAAGFRAVAPDMRGYGQSDRPEQSINTRCCILSATWWVLLMRSASTRQRSPATIGELRSRGIRRCCAPTVSVP